jgi:glycosyltransferase involved in cell wall biosynthesis
LNILYVYQGEWPRGATRVAKQVNSLARAGHAVHLVCRNYNRAARVERWGQVTVHRMPCVPVAPVNRALNFPLFLNPFWIWAIWRVGRTTGADCVIVADLPLAPAAMWVGRWLGVPVHYDMAEVYPEFLKSLWKVGHLSAADRVLRSPRAAALVERYVLRAVRSISVVSEESRDRAIAVGAPPGRTVVVGNTPEDVESLIGEHPFPADLESLAHRPRAVFVGVLIADRGVTEAVEAFPMVLREIPDASLVIVGDGPDRARLDRTVQRLRLGDHVKVLGWREHKTLAGFYQHCHVGLLPFLDTPHVRVTMANKLFDYMAAGLPVLGSDLPPIRRVLDETQAGVLFPPGNRQVFAERLVELLRNADHRRTLGANGRRAVTEKYRWTSDEAVFLESIGGFGATPAAQDPTRLIGAEP